MHVEVVTNVAGTGITAIGIANVNLLHASISDSRYDMTQCTVFVTIQK